MTDALPIFTNADGFYQPGVHSPFALTRVLTSETKKSESPQSSSHTGISAEPVATNYAPLRELFEADEHPLLGDGQFGITSASLWEEPRKQRTGSVRSAGEVCVISHTLSARLKTACLLSQSG